MRRSGPPSTRSRYQSPATRPGLRTAFMSPPSVTGFSGFPDDTPNVAGKVSAVVVSRSAELRQIGARSHAHRHSRFWIDGRQARRSEEHTSELQSQSNLVCRLLLEKKKNNII